MSVEQIPGPKYDEPAFLLYVEHESEADPYKNWERFEPYIAAEVVRFAAQYELEPEMRDDVAQEMRLRMCQELAKDPAVSDFFVQTAMRYAACDFCRRVAFDGPHDADGYRQSERVVSLDSER